MSAGAFEKSALRGAYRDFRYEAKLTEVTYNIRIVQ